MTTKRFEALDGINTIGPTTVANTLTVSSNVAIDTNILFVDTVANRVGVNKIPIQGALDVSGNVHATAFVGDGSFLTGINIPTNVLINDANNTYSDGRFTISSNSSFIFTANSFLQFSDGRPINFGTSGSVVAQGNSSGLFFTGSNVVINSATFYLDSTNGRIGIGNTAPTEMLHVQGKIRIGTQATATTDAVRADRLISTGDGLSGGGDLTVDRSIALDSTVVRTSGNQTITGIKSFANTITGNISGNAGTVTNGVYTTGDQTIGGIKTFSNTIVGNITGSAGSVDGAVYTTGDQTISGIKTFSNTIVGNINGNATTASASTTATRLQTARNINGTSFNGTASITTTQWGASRNITIGSTTRSVNGSTTYSWTLSDIGAASTNITLTAGDGLTGGGSLAENRTFAVDSTVVRTTGTQTIAGNKTFSDDVRIDSLGVGTTASGVAGEIRATGNITGYFSDQRLKTKVNKIEDALNKVNHIDGIYFELNDLAKSFGYAETDQQVGVLAQQIQQVLPQVVSPAPFDISVDSEGNEISKSGENYLTVHYEKLVPLLIEAIKELSLKVEILEEKLK
jgi:hypothetical protein